MNSAHVWFLLIVILLWLSVKLIQMYRKPPTDSPHSFEGHEPSKENWKLIIKYSLIVGLCFGLLFDLGLRIKTVTTFFLFVGFALVFVVPALAVGKKIVFRRFFHAGAIGIIGSSLGVVFSIFFEGYIQPQHVPGDAGGFGQSVAFGIIFFGGLGFLSSFLMGCLAILSGKYYDKKRGTHSPGQG